MGQICLGCQRQTVLAKIEWARSYSARFSGVGFLVKQNREPEGSNTRREIVKKTYTPHSNPKLHLSCTYHGWYWVPTSGSLRSIT